MSDYIFMLESHLNPDQNRVVEEVQAAAQQHNLNLFLTGGAMRDMLGGFRIRDLDFSVEGHALKVAKTVVDRTGAVELEVDEQRRSVELLFSSGVTAQICLSRQETYSRPGGQPQVTPSTIQEDLRRRDFTINAVALSLNKASRGLLLDPLNGLADLERRELRLVSPYGFYDDPVRLLRLLRFQARFGFTVESRTQTHFENARQAATEQQIGPRTLLGELRNIAAEDCAAEIVRILAEAGLLRLYLAGAAPPLAELAKLEKAEQVMPDDPPTRAARFAPFLWALTGSLAARDKQLLVKTLEMTKAEADAWLKLEVRARKLETELKAAGLRKPSQVYQLLTHAAPGDVLFVLYHSPLKTVQERIRNYYEKYLPLVAEIPAEEFAGIEHKPGTPKYAKAHADIIYKALDRRPKKVVEEEEPPPPPEPVATRGRGLR